MTSTQGEILAESFIYLFLDRHTKVGQPLCQALPQVQSTFLIKYYINLLIVTNDPLRSHLSLLIETSMGPLTLPVNPNFHFYYPFSPSFISYLTTRHTHFCFGAKWKLLLKQPMLGSHDGTNEYIKQHFIRIH